MDLNQTADNCATGVGSGLIDASSLPQACADSSNLKTIFLIVLAIIGALAFLFLVIGGARYVMSKGEADRIQQAKNEIKYALMGLIIVALSAAGVNFVLGRL